MVDKYHTVVWVLGLQMAPQYSLLTFVNVLNPFGATYNIAWITFEWLRVGKETFLNFLTRFVESMWFPLYKLSGVILNVYGVQI